MAVEIEILDGLERRLVLFLKWDLIEAEVNSRLKNTQKRLRMDGFRPGKVPFKMVEGMYRTSIQNDVLNDKAFKTFYDLIEQEAIKVAGLKKLEVLPESDDKAIVKVAAVFEVIPDNIDLGDLSSKEVNKIIAEVEDKDVEKTLEVLRKQRVKFEPVDRAAATSDKAEIDFVGKIEGEVFEGGTAENYAVLLGQGQMLPEFEQGLIGMKLGESKEVEVNFPESYHGKEVAGKKAVFAITLKNLYRQVLPELDAEFAKSLGIEDGDLDKMREEVKVNLTREVTRRVERLNKEAVINLLLSCTDFAIPQVMVDKEITRLHDQAVQKYLDRGMSKENVPELGRELFKEQAEKSVKIGLILNRIMDKESLVASKDQVRAVIEDIAQNYEDPAEVLRYYLNNKEEYANAKSVATEKNIVDFILKQVKTKEVRQSFDELMKM